MRDLKIYFGIGCALLLVYLVAQYNKPLPVDWRQTYLRKDKIPFGTYVLYDRLPDIFPEAERVVKRNSPYSLLDDSLQRSVNYLVIAARVDLSEHDLEKMREFMRGGNSIFIASYNLRGAIVNELHAQVNSVTSLLDKKKWVRFVNPGLDSTRHYIMDKGAGDQFFGKFDTTKATVLAVNQDNDPVMLRYRFGKGSLYLVAGPQYFTNYAMLKPGGADFAAKSLSYLGTSRQILWDEYFTRGGFNASRSHLDVILGNPAVRWAYYIALFSLIVFVLYEMKRRQRIIPVADPMKNTTVEFVRVVGQLYYRERDNRDIASKKISYLLENIRSKYNLNTSKLSPEFGIQLSNKSGIMLEKVDQLLHILIVTQSAGRVNDKQLIDLHKQIELFYKQSGIYGTRI